MTPRRITRRVKEAQRLLAALGMDPIRSNERSARTLLALLDLDPADDWSSASSPMIGIHGIREWISAHLRFDYAVGSRETIRKQTLHQFEDSGLIVANPDDPDRAVNSKDSNYQVVPEALPMLRAYGTDAFDGLLCEWKEVAPGLLTRYAAARESHRIPVTLPDGRAISLSAGGQNVLLQRMILDFCEHFTPGGEVLYVGDADDKFVHFEKERLAVLGLTFDEHGKMPDLIVFWPEKNWLLLLEAVTSHGPMDGRRRGTLSELFASSTAGLVYVSCFPDRLTFRRYVQDIAWETEVWCADNPTHMIHFNGERFLGPYE